jgi:hypothetical protein
MAETFRTNPALNTAEVVTQLGVGEALVSFLENKGTPMMVERCFIHPPVSRIGPITEDERKETISRSPLKGIYEQVIDRESAYELLKSRTAAAEKARGEEEAAKAEAKAAGRQPQGIFEAFFKSAMRTFGSTVSREIARGVMGSIFGGRRR